jgi:hypothetical protein
VVERGRIAGNGRDAGSESGFRHAGAREVLVGIHAAYEI